jgi:hypothetical protein
MSCPICTKIFTFSDKDINKFEKEHPEMIQKKSQLELINDYVKQKGIEAEQKRQKLINETKPKKRAELIKNFFC